MDEVHNKTPEQEALDAVAAKIKADKLLKYQQDVWIDFNALGGLIVEADGSFKMSKVTPDKQYTVQDLANDLGVARSTLYRWTKEIPNFWDKVRERRRVVGSRARVQKVWNGVFLKASAGNPQAAALFLANFDEDFKMPTQKLEHSAGSGFADALNKAREIKRIANKSIEGEVVDAAKTTNT